MDHIFRVVGEAVAREYFTLEGSSKQGISIIWEKKKTWITGCPLGKQLSHLLTQGHMLLFIVLLMILLEYAGLYSSRARWPLAPNFCSQMTRKS